MEETQLKDAPELEEDDDKQPLGTYAPFDISDEKELTKEALDQEGIELAENIRAMVVAACQRESLGRRLEIEQAWRLQLMDRGFHRLIPRGKAGGWEIAYQNSPQGIFGGMYAANLHDVNIIGVHNDIIVNAGCRDMPKTEFTPKSDEDKAVTAAAAANKIKWMIQEDAGYKDAQAMLWRTYCTDERAALYMRPVADARYGFEDDGEDVVPETEESTPETKPSKRPKIQTVLSVFGKLEHKCQIAVDDGQHSPYQIIAHECDTASIRAEFPWIAAQITGGSAGIAEIELDRVARASIKLAIQGGMVTGQGNTNDTTKLRCWLTPKFYWDDSCSEKARKRLLQIMPKGLLAVYAGTELAFARNESWEEVLTVSHARSGKGQNRRALTEAYAGVNMVLDQDFDLIQKFFTSTVPRVFLDEKAFNVPQIRQSGNQVGRIEPFNSAVIPQGSTPMLQMPMPTHQAALPDFIHWLSSDLAELLTGAQLTLQGAQDEGQQGTLGEAQMDNAAAMTRLSEPWGANCKAFSNATRQAVEWNARVQPKGTVFDRQVGAQGRLRVELEQISASDLAIDETDTNFPESWSEREEKAWQMVQASPTNPFISSIVTNPANARIFKDAARMGIKVAGAASWEKQEGEFTVLLAGAPQPNPKVQLIRAQIAQLKTHLEQGAQDVRTRQVMGQPVDPTEVQALQEGLQTIQQLTQQMQQLPPLISTVPVRADGSEEDAIEMMCCLDKMISPDGRRMVSSKSPLEQAAFANLHLHWNEHKTAMEQMAKDNQTPVEPKTSITLAVDKMPGEAQAALLSKIGVVVDPAAFDQMGPHEVTHEVEGVNESGAKEKVTTSLVGKQLT